MFIEIAVIVVVSLALTYALRPSIPKVVAPKPGEFETPTCEDGALIPVVFGTVQVRDPNITWFGDVSYLPYSKSGQLVGYVYWCSLRMEICHGEIDQFRAIVVGDKVAWEGAPVDNVIDLNRPSLFGGNDAEGGLVGQVVTNRGTFSTALNAGMRDPICASEGYNDGWGPGYYGIASVLLNHMEVGRSPYLKPWSFRVKRIHKRHLGVAQWQDDYAEIPSGIDREGIWKYRVLDPVADVVNYNAEFTGISYDDTTTDWATGQGGFGNAPIGNAGNAMMTVTVNTRVIPTIPINAGTRIWLRRDLGPINQENLCVQCWHDDTGDLWFNETKIDLIPLNWSDDHSDHFTSYAIIPASLINPSGSNVIAYRVTDSTTGSGGNNTYIYAGCQVGSDDGAVPSDDENPVSGFRADMNPIHIIRECLSNPIWGMGYLDADIDETSFLTAAITIYGERLGISIEWNKATSIQEFIEEILKHISAVLYVDRETGKFCINLIRADYIEDDLIVLDETCVSSVEDAKRPAIGELVNSVTVTYTNTISGDAGSATVQDTGLIQSQGAIIPAKFDYPGLTSHYQAYKAALRNLQVFSAPLLTCTINTGRWAAGLNVGDPFILDWHVDNLEIDNMVMRVVSIELGDGVSTLVKITAIEDVFDPPQFTVTNPNGTGWRVPVPTYLPDTTNFYPARTYDPLDRTGNICAFCYRGVASDPHSSSTNLFGGWTETEPGVLERDIEGPWDVMSETDATVFDGVDLDVMNSTTHLPCPYQGQLIFAGPFNFEPEEFPTEDLLDQQKLTGPWLLTDAGGHWDWVDDDHWVWTSTKAKLTRPGLYGTSAPYTQGATFEVREGTVYGGKFISLETPNVVYGTTRMTWTVSDTFTPDIRDMLETTDQIAADNVMAGDTVDLTVSATNESALSDVDFTTPARCPAVTSIPAGPWRFDLADVHLDAYWTPSTGSTTKAIVAVYRVRGVTETLLFTAESAAVTTTVSSPLSFTYQAAAFECLATDQIRVKMGISTTSTDFVTMIIRAMSIGQSFVQIPITLGDPDAIGPVHTPTSDVTLTAGGLILIASAVPSVTSNSIRLLGCEGLEIRAIETTGFEVGDRLIIRIGDTGTAFIPLTPADPTDPPAGIVWAQIDPRISNDMTTTLDIKQFDSIELQLVETGSSTYAWYPTTIQIR